MYEDLELVKRISNEERKKGDYIMVTFAIVLTCLGAIPTFAAGAYMLVDSCILGHYHNPAM